MGQKIHPYGFRLGKYKPHYATWFGLKNTYSAQLFEDLQIRHFFQTKYKYTGILAVHISRRINNHISINLFCTRTNIFLTSRTKNLLVIRIKLQQYLAKHQSSFLTNLYFAGQFNKYCQPMQVSLHLNEVKKYERNATFLAIFLIDQLEKRISFRKAIQKTFKRLDRVKVNGVKIQISGRLNGAEIARTEWLRHGRVPLHTLKANIDYCHRVAYTIYGILGIKNLGFHEQNSTFCVKKIIFLCYNQNELNIEKSIVDVCQENLLEVINYNLGNLAYKH